MKYRLILVVVVVFFSVLSAPLLLAQGNRVLEGEVEVPDDTSLKPAQITVEAWVNPTSLPTWATILMNSASTWRSGYGLAHYEGTDDVHFFINHFSDNNVTGTLVTRQSMSLS